MMRSLFSGVSGLKSHQTRMDVIGNNIANVNTTAYKSSSMVFSDLMSQTTQSASGPNATTGTGGINARQIGLGVKTGAINTNISTQGAAQSTGNPFDIMINGDAFFVVSDGSDNFFTRDGSFYVDGAGNLAMTSNGFNVMGWQVDEETMSIKQDTVSALRIMSAANMTYPPEATSKAYVSGIIDKNNTDVTSTSGKAINLNFYDALGYSYTARLVFKQSTETNRYSVELEKILDSTGAEVDLNVETANGTERVSIGNGEAEQNTERTVALDTSTYYWDGTTLKYKSDDTIAADLQAIFDNTGNLLSTDEAVIATRDKYLNELAKAYGYEGSVEEFLGLQKDLVAEQGENFTSGTFSLQTLFANAAHSKNPSVMALGNKATAAGETLNSFSTDSRIFDGIIVNFDAANGPFTGIGDETSTVTTAKLNLSLLGGNFSDIEIDFSECSMFDNSGACTVAATSGDLKGLGMGRKLGEMSGVAIQQNGMIYASYDNGMTKLLGQIAVAEFANASGLEKQGNNLYSASMNSGEFDGIGIDITVNGGTMSTGQLEMSNVDLSAEFTEMITTQRGFQANSRIITVSDTLLEELTNLKR